MDYPNIFYRMEIYTQLWKLKIYSALLILNFFPVIIMMLLYDCMKSI